jgi:hypothetical protein
VIRNTQDPTIRRALKAFPIPNPLTVESLFAVLQERYPRPLELWRGPSPLPGLHANALWLTRPGEGSDVIWLDQALTGAAAVHSLSHEIGHIELGHTPLEMPTRQREPEPYKHLSQAFLGGNLLCRARSHEGPQEPAYRQVEDQAEQFAFELRRAAAAQTEARHGDPLVDRVRHSL